MAVKLGETLDLTFSTRDPLTLNDADADSTPTQNVYENGGVTPLTLVGASITNITTGLYMAEIVADATSGFEVGKNYNWVVIATVGGVTQSKTLATFSVSATTIEEDVAAVASDVDGVKAKTDQLAFTVANQVDANALTGGGGASVQDMIDGGIAIEDGGNLSEIRAVNVVAALRDFISSAGILESGLDMSYDEVLTGDMAIGLYSSDGYNSTLLATLSASGLVVESFGETGNHESLAIRIESDSVSVFPAGTLTIDIPNVKYGAARTYEIEVPEVAIDASYPTFFIGSDGRLKLDSGEFSIVPPAAGGSPVGSGSNEVDLTLQVSGTPIEGAAVWISTDALGVNIVAGTLYTSALGEVQFMLDDGDYYVWRQLGGYNMTNPQALVVSGATSETINEGSVASAGDSIEDICSSALISLGQTGITDINGTDEKATVCRTKFYHALDALIRPYRWKFAVTRVTLDYEQSGGNPVVPEFGYDYQFVIPSDCVRVLEPDPEEYYGELDHVIEGQRILSDETQIKISYLRRITDPTAWDQSFKDVFIYRLAAEIALAITGDKERADLMWAAYKDKLRDARPADGKQGKPRETTIDTLGRVRR